MHTIRNRTEREIISFEDHVLFTIDMNLMSQRMRRKTCARSNLWMTSYYRHYMPASKHWLNFNQISDVSTDSSADWAWIAWMMILHTNVTLKFSILINLPYQFESYNNEFYMLIVDFFSISRIICMMSKSNKYVTWCN